MNDVDLERCNIGLAKSRGQGKWREWKRVRKWFGYTLWYGHISMQSDIYRRFRET